MSYYHLHQLNCDREGCESALMGETAMELETEASKWFRLVYTIGKPAEEGDPEGFLEMLSQEGGPQLMDNYFCSKSCLESELNDLERD